MNTDRELLELAAKAYFAQDVADGVCSFRWDEKEDAIFYIHADNQDHNGNDVELLWIPHADDGDALRLAVKRMLEVDVCRTGIAVRTPIGHIVLVDSKQEPDPYAATRLAIVRAAAHIGEAMP